MLAKEEEAAVEASEKRQPAPPCVVVIFGASGDLTKRKLIPALYNLAAADYLPQEFAVLGVSRTEMSDDDFRRKMSENLHEFETGPVEPERLKWLAERLYYIPHEVDSPASYVQVAARLAEL